jgi:nucleobase:cation symporter-1, NCS1 family
VLARASWGFWGSYLAIVSRCILAIFWFAIQTMNGANCVRVMLGAIWPSFLTIQNTIPEDQGITTNTMAAFVIFWLFQVPFLLLHPNQLRWLFIAKSIIVPIAFLAILIWSFRATSGGEIFNQQATISGSAYSWAWLASLTSVLGNYATLSVNQADFSRYSKVSVKWQILYVPLLPIIFTFISFIGIAASSAGAALYGTLQWDPMALVSEWDNRAAQFFAAFAFALAALGVNISANSLSAANDLMALMPSYINIRRGQVICAFLSWVLVPWKILASAGSFLNFMSAYAIFLGPIASILLFDFWLIHQRKYDAAALYTYGGIYHYTCGINWRAWTAFVVGVVPSLPGLINSVNSSVDPGQGIHPYQFGWLLGFVATTIVYLPLCWIFPPYATFVDRAVLPDEVYAAAQVVGGLERDEEEVAGALEEVKNIVKE